MANSVISQVLSVLNDNTKSMTSRRADVIKLVGEVEGCRLIAEWLRANPQPSAPSVSIGRYTFGVELECANVNADRLVAECRAHGLQMLDQSRRSQYNHTDSRTSYKMVYDGSLSGADPKECVSPVLNGDNGGFGSIKALCTSLNTIGAEVNRSCGYHVHVGGDITDRQYVNVFINYQMLQSVIDSFMAPSRRNCHWSAPLNDHDLSQCQTPADVDAALHYDRYHAVNPQAWHRHRTIEFRQHAGTTNAKKVTMWAKFCLKLVAWSASHRLTSEVASISEIPFLTAAEKSYFKSRQQELSPATANA